MLMRGVLTALCIMLFAIPASAHKIILNAWGEGDTLITETGFSDGSAGKESKITVTDATTGAEVLTGVADENGLFEAQIPAEVIVQGHDLQVVTNAGAGHQAKATVSGDEFSPPVESPAAEKNLSEQGATASSDAVKVMVKQAVREEIKPLRREIMTMADKGPSLSTILGGIGYIFGLAGVAALVGARRRHNETAHK